VSRDLFLEWRLWRRSVPVEPVQYTDRNFLVGNLVAMDGVGTPQVVEGVHVLGDGAVLPGGQQVTRSNHCNLLRLEEFPHPAVLEWTDPP
jgi:hypothetical protein